MPDPKKKPIVPTTERYKNAKKVSTLPTGEEWTAPVTIDNKTYTDKASKDAVPGKPGSMSPNDLIIWKQGLIDRVRGGENPYTMRDKGYFSDPALLGELAKEYQAVYTEPIKSNSITVPLSPYAGTRKGETLLPKNSADQSWDTIRFADLNGQTNQSVDRHFNKDLQEIDPLTGKLSGKTVADYRAANQRSDAQGTTMLPNSVGGVPVIKDTSNVFINKADKFNAAGSSTSGGFKQGGLVKRNYKHGGLLGKIKGYAEGGNVKLPTNDPDEAELMGSGQIMPTFANQGLTSTGQQITPEQKKRAYGITGPQKSGDIVGDALSSAGQGAKAGEELGGTEGAAIGAGLGLAGSLAPNLINAGTQDAYGRYDTGSKAGDYAAGIGSQGLGGAAKGAALGASFGAPGMLIGAGAGLVGGGIMGGIKASKDIKSIADEEQAKQLSKQQQEQVQRNTAWQRKYDKEMQDRGFNKGGLIAKIGCKKMADGGEVNNLSDNPLNGTPRNQNGVPLYFSPSEQELNKVNTQYDQYGESAKVGFGSGGGGLKLPTASFKDGGKIEGVGGPKSDSINAKVKSGSFVVPAENAPKAMIIREKVLKAPSAKKKANLNQSGGEKIKVSNGEVLFSEKEVEKVENKLGEGVLEELAPNADKHEDMMEISHMKEGGEVEKKKAVSKSYAEYQKALADNDPFTGTSPDRVQELKTAYEAAANDLKQYYSKSKAPTTKSMTGSDRELAFQNQQIRSRNPLAEPINIDEPKIYSATGEKIMGGGKSTPNRYSSNGLVNKVRFNPASYSTNEDVTAPLSASEIAANNKAIADAEALNSSAMAYEKTNPYTSPTETGRGLTSQQALGLASQGRGLVSALTNQILPRKQVKMGLDFLSKVGARPVDTILPEEQASINRAQTQAQYGYTPEEQASINQQNQAALNAGRFAARNYAGGSSANAYNMERQAINESFGRGLQSAIANRKLQLSKQERADEMVGQKQELNRRLFQDTMNAWNQNQQAGSTLVSTGLANQIGASRYADAMLALQQNKALENPSYNINLG